jgi:hypothetical protein
MKQVRHRQTCEPAAHPYQTRLQEREESASNRSDEHLPERLLEKQGYDRFSGV